MTIAQLLTAALGENAFHMPEGTLEAQEALRPAWDQYLERVRAGVPDATIEDGGETVYTGALSAGCRACKTGNWDCLFLTMDCNLACPFCCSPSSHSSQPALSALGREVEQVVANLRIVQPEGISFSGGEVFLEFKRLRELVTMIRRAFPQAYLWAYTNGLLADGEKLAEMGELGLDEMRFNLAASGYSSPQVLQHLEQAARCIPHVTVEIPAIPEHAEKLLAALPAWNSAGVQYLNLHELMFEPGSLSAGLPGPRTAMRTPDGHFTEFHPLSRPLVLRVMQQIQAQGLPLAVNDCSMQNKLRQVRGRRALMGRLAHNQPGSTEKLGPDGLLESICALGDQEQAVFIHPDDFEEARDDYPGWRFARLWRVPPLSVFTSSPWQRYEEITA